jgi:hypothetical protein
MRPRGTSIKSRRTGLSLLVPAGRPVFGGPAGGGAAFPPARGLFSSRSSLESNTLPPSHAPAPSTGATVPPAAPQKI